MPSETQHSVLDRLWRSLEERYDPDEFDCSCGASEDAQTVLDETDLTRSDVAAYQRGEQTLADLAAKVDADLDLDSIDDAQTFIEKLAAENTPSDESTPT